MDKLIVLNGFDATGEQIYEGDILEREGDLFIVIYDSFYCAFGLFPLTFQENYYATQISNFEKFSFTLNELLDYHLIGDIYKNPELIINAFKQSNNA